VVALGKELARRPGADPHGFFEPDDWRRCAEVGLTGLIVDEEHGGQGADALTAVLALEALGYACGDNGLAFSLGAQLWSVAAPLQRFGTAEQHRRYLPGICRGEVVGAHGMSEPESGSDAFALSTRVQADGDGWVLDGRKTFVTNAPIADVFVLFGTTDPAKGWAGLCAFVVDRDTPGLTVGPPMTKMGLWSSPMAEVFLDGCRVGAGAILGRPGAGMAVFNHSMEWERGCILAPSVGAMQRQVEQAVAYARSRRQFGQAIGSFQAVANRIVDMAVRAEAARMLLYKMAWEKASGRRADAEASMVKLFVSESWTASSLDQVLVHGGAGYLVETGVERDLRDAVASQIYSGTNDIQRNLVARHLGL
jgi:alkylation response protein AidB-like acyl-CoA dehydrogenase